MEISHRVPFPPDYSNPDFWAALPEKSDSADLTPGMAYTDQQSKAEVDVFFIHPTTYIGNKGQKYWNAPLDDKKLNVKTDRSAIRNQASIFNEAARVYAPRYRQAHLEVYYTKRFKEQAKQALDIAYKDVRAAFQHYLENYNQGRPIIIAAHSQGTTHAGTLLREFFDEKKLQDKLVVAYLVGMPVKNDYFKSIEVCQSPEQTGCFCSWRSFKKGFYPKKWYFKNGNIAVTNPLSWTIEETHAPKSLNEGGVLQKFHNEPTIGLADAQIRDGMLWISKPKFPGSFFLLTRNYHIADFNFFYVNVRKNAVRRVESYLAPD
jgi:hypothetical protein